jgi:hypothetical protein
MPSIGRNWTVFRRHLAELISLVLSLVALVLAALWYKSTLDYEPLITSIGIAAAILAFFVEPWLEKRSTRKDMILAIIFAIAHNIAILGNRRFNPDIDLSEGRMIYPRLIYSCLDRVLSSGLFNDDKDGELRSATLNARVYFENFNNYLMAFEIRSLFLPDTEELRRHHKEMVSSELYHTTMERMSSLTKVIVRRYSKEADLDLSAVDPTDLLRLR